MSEPRTVAQTQVSTDSTNRCPWFDEDCCSVKDHYYCWDDPENRTGDRRPGYCPFVHGPFGSVTDE
jgi:hypothetical protein